MTRQWAAFDEHPGLWEWLNGSDTGLSSKCMVDVLAFNSSGSWYPLDPSDFGRCERLLRAVPSLRPLLSKMADVSPVWAGLVGAWDELVSTGEREVPGAFDSRHVTGRAPLLYKRMQEIEAQGRAATR